MEKHMSIRALTFVLLATLAGTAIIPLAGAAESEATAQPSKAKVAGVVTLPSPAQGVVKTRTKSNNSDDLVAATPVAPGTESKHNVPKTKSNIKND
jgi:hypothetical protein